MPRRTSDGLDDSLGYLVRRTHQAFSRAIERRVAKHDISLSMYFFLRLLREADGLSQKEISDELGLQPSTIVSAMDNLAERKLIVRQRSLEDRRKVNIFLTEEGHALNTKLRRYAREVNTTAASGLTEEEQEQLWTLLDRVRHALVSE